MARTPKLYQKLVRRRGGIGTYCSLWLAADHVLLVEANMMTERYQRVWLRDVQGFLVSPSMESRWVTGVSLGFFTLFAGLALGVGGNAVLPLSIFAGLSAMVVLYGMFLARTCRFHVFTAVQRTEWTNVARRRQARKLIVRLEPLIRDAQVRDILAGAPALPMPDTTTETGPTATVTT